jgi:hypothetical protein
MRRAPRLLIVVALAVMTARPLSALELRVSSLQIASSRVALALELRDLLRDKFLQTVEQGRAVFLQMQAELWEDRRIADRLALTTPSLTYRVDRAEKGVTITDQYGNAVPHADMRMALPIRLDIGSATGLADDRVYYVRAAITAATFEERDIDRMGVAIFGDDDSIAGLANLGRYLFGTALRIGRYLESATAEVSGPRYTGLQIRTGRT